ncbi:fructosamine kinase family protein [Leptolyngbya sp. FACHB-261]|uniref:fructosamine kinase family protein n=1 Tax=Leptolyngbya sp. FACHB-261 TaxID=2692806 RepID=UPI001688BC85|nr:fructosamine kinase family protein [Leptolyngbya sp. FACHB-261]MBD2105291.1 fructosamine kinase family protein [Leptolyngbya sp. FACHB-261]
MNTQIPESIGQEVIAALRQSGDKTPLRDTQETIPGGVSETLLLKTDLNVYFLKWNEKPWFGTFTNEAFQLSLLRQTNTVTVPVVIGFAEAEQGQPAWMLQEWAGTTTQDDAELRLGRKLGQRIAELHAATSNTAPGYGYVERNEDGSTQLPTQDWASFLYEAHLRHHIERARKENRWTTERNQRVDRLVEQLPNLLAGVRRAPTLLHGDLHSGNIRLAQNGEPVLVDPWLFYGDREIEIVSTFLSGDFPPTFYASYNEIFPLEPDFQDRVDLYKLVWLLSGLYYSSEASSGEDNAIADPILAHYVG